MRISVRRLIEIALLLIVTTLSLHESALAQQSIRLLSLETAIGSTDPERLEEHAAQQLETLGIPSSRNVGIYRNETSVLPNPRNPLAALDFSGVAFSSHPPGLEKGVHPRRGILIARDILLSSKHTGAKAGFPVYFATPDGTLIERQIIGRRGIGRVLDGAGKYVTKTDVTVSFLDRPVPDDVAVYPLLDVGSDSAFRFRGHRIPALLLNQHREVIPARTVGERSAGLRLAFAPYSEEHAYRAISGDSGYPIFTLINGELVPLSHHWFAGYGDGPNFTNRELLDAILMTAEKGPRETD
ncbi:hypothetical protein HK107_11175 [Parvularcula sp. ZS-1/3]|uniref:Uncharacterized protein n=1 Tax=Parvularcula mediterranea TaxID=2732508 RepID=A0A7Y3RMR9_9PROT|nr:hypothetical protein [Parvularcula mediterranea]NNU16879.1 hypothetical protein [Parvularcula mediterranea]